MTKPRTVYPQPDPRIHDRAIMAYLRRCQRTGHIFDQPGWGEWDGDYYVIGNRHGELARYALTASGHLRFVDRD